MKKYLSVFEMITRSTLYKVLITLVLMVVAQFFLFGAELKETFSSGNDEIIIGMENIVDESYLVVPLAIGFVLMTIILCWCGCNIGSNQGYTLRRLQIGERAVFCLQILYNCLCYVLLWASQVAVTVGISHLYVQHAAELTNQTVVLAYYKNSYMHSVLPMEDGRGWALLIFLIIGCGVAAAAFPVQQRRGKIGFSMIVAVALALVCFPNGIDADYRFVFVCLAFFCMASVALLGVFVGSEEEQDNE